jgi:hypothetical protein
LELDGAILADLQAGRPEALQPERPKDDEGRMFADSPMWAEYDVGNNSFSTGRLYRLQGDWQHAGEMAGRAVPYYKDLVELNPAVATFTGDLFNVFNRRVEAAEHVNDRQQVADSSKDAVAFWNRMVELHPDIPDLKTYADGAQKADAEVALWLADATTQPSSTQP